MNVRLKYYIEFTAGVYYQNQVSMANYRVNLNLLTASMDGDEQNIALDRIKYFVYKCLHSSVFIDNTQIDACRALVNAGVKIATLPADPFDQVVGIMLFTKLNSICEDRMLVTDIEISSDLGDHVTYSHNDEESIGMFDQIGWWNEPTLVHYDNEIIQDEKTMWLNRNNGWRDIGLEWPSAQEESKDLGNTVVFADFHKND